MSDLLLADRLRLETRDLHAAAERAGAMAALLRGQLALPRYCALLCNLLAIYVALECALDARQTDPHVAPVHLPQLYRSAALASDLAVLRVRGVAEPALEDAAATYAQRLAQLAQAGSPALVAHAYVRYLGDLYGGQTLKRVVTKAYGLGADSTQFYEFGDAAAVQAQRLAFREALAAVPATSADADLIVAEARWAFEQHQRLFEQLMVRPETDFGSGEHSHT